MMIITKMMMTWMTKMMLTKMTMMMKDGGGRGASSPADLTLGICHDGNFAPVSHTICNFDPGSF